MHLLTLITCVCKQFLRKICCLNKKTLKTLNGELCNCSRPMATASACPTNRIWTSVSMLTLTSHDGTYHTCQPSLLLMVLQMSILPFGAA